MEIVNHADTEVTLTKESNEGNPMQILGKHVIRIMRDITAVEQPPAITYKAFETATKKPYYLDNSTELVIQWQTSCITRRIHITDNGKGCKCKIAISKDIIMGGRNIG